MSKADTCTIPPGLHERLTTLSNHEKLKLLSSEIDIARFWDSPEWIDALDDLLWLRLPA